MLLPLSREWNTVCLWCNCVMPTKQRDIGDQSCCLAVDLDTGLVRGFRICRSASLVIDGGAIVRFRRIAPISLLGSDRSTVAFSTAVYLLAAWSFGNSGHSSIGGSYAQGRHERLPSARRLDGEPREEIIDRLERTRELAKQA